MYVAPIQTASALPFFVLGLPAGAIGCPLDSSFVLISMARPRMFDDAKTTRGREVKILERAETMSDGLPAPNGLGKTLLCACRKFHL